jgi:hypothetical protein
MGFKQKINNIKMGKQENKDAELEKFTILKNTKTQ